MPLVTVLDSPSGAPRATTGWPILRFEELPIAIVWRLDLSTRMTARSVSGSRPTRVACAASPLSNTTSRAPPPSAGAITWLFVTMYPSDRITSPEPTPPPAPPWAKIVTTAGSCCSATEVTLHDGPVVSAVLVATVVVVLVVDLLLVTRPTTTAAASRTITPMASGTNKRVRREPGEDTAINPFWSPRASSRCAGSYGWA